MYTNRFKITAADLFDPTAPHNVRAFRIAKVLRPDLTMDEHLLGVEEMCDRFGGITQYLEIINGIFTNTEERS